MFILYNTGTSPDILDNDCLIESYKIRRFFQYNSAEEAYENTDITHSYVTYDKRGYMSTQIIIITNLSSFVI